MLLKSIRAMSPREARAEARALVFPGSAALSAKGSAVPAVLFSGSLHGADGRALILTAPSVPSEP